MIKPIDLFTLEDTIGLQVVEEVTGIGQVTKDDLKRIAAREGVTQCFVIEWGAIVTMDYRTDRCRVVTRDGVIIRASRG